MSEFYGDDESFHTEQIAGLVKERTSNGSRRLFVIPASNLTICENWDMRNGPGTYIEPPSQVYDLSGAQLADLKSLVDAKRAFDSARVAYMEAQIAFRKSETGKWIEKELAPVKTKYGEQPRYRSQDAAELYFFQQDCMTARNTGTPEYIIMRNSTVPMVKIRGVSENDHFRYIHACVSPTQN